MLGVLAAILLIAALALYAARRNLAREALTGWLESKGIASEAQVESFGPAGATARLRIGDPRNPDVTVERAEVQYGLRGLGLEVRSVRLVRPVVRARLQGGKFSVGSLDPLIEEFRRRPPKPDARKPRIEIDDGVLLLATDYGPLRLSGDGLVNDGRLASLTAASAPARLKGRGFDLELGAGALRVTSKANRLDVSVDAPLAKADAGGLAVRNGRLQVSAAGPYPDLEKKRGEGGLTVRANLAGRELALAGQSLGSAEIAAAFDGQTRGWIDTLAVTGRATAELRAGTGRLGPGEARMIRARAVATDVAWTRRGGDALAARLQLIGGADALTADDLTLQRVVANFAGPLKVTKDGAVLNLAGGATGHGSWSGLGAPGQADSRDMAAVKRAVRGFRIEAPGLAVNVGGGPALALRERAILRPDSGGEVRITPRGSAYDLAMAGGGLPKVDAQVSRFSIAGGGAVAVGRAKATLSIGPVEQGVFDASGTLRIKDGVRFAADRCVGVTIPKLELGENDVEALAGRLCPQGRPVLELAGGGWTIAGAVQGASASVPFLQAKVADASARIVLGEARGRLHATAAIADAQVTDAAPSTRFNPVRMSGRALLAREQWTADLAFRTPGGVQVATARLRHDGTSGRGGVELATGKLTFAEGALQPEQLSPLAEVVGSPAVGSASFTGGFDWTKAATTSRGTLDVSRLDFESPAGRVTGLSGEIVFTSLAPLRAAPGQILRAEGVAAIAPLANVTTTFSLEDEAIRISGGEAQVGGGRIVIESLEVPLDAQKATKGVLIFEGVQLHDLVEASPLGDKVEFDAKVSGRLPFEATGQRIRILGGDLKAIQPGRISIQRTALTGVQAEGEVSAEGAAPDPAATTDTFTDFAYQAMENLAFDTLDASIRSQENGRLGVRFHIIGRHDPPQKQEIRLTWIELIRRNFMNRKLPLPSGTGVNLTLDTTLNLDELMRDYAEYERLRSSGPVQPR